MYRSNDESFYLCNKRNENEKKNNARKLYKIAEHKSSD